MNSKQPKFLSIYPIGSFANDEWRDRFIDSLPDFDFNDPRNHDQSSITRLVHEDMKAAMKSDIALVYLHNEKRAGTFSYCELGGARAKGKPIIVVDLNSTSDSLIEKIASEYLESEEEAIDLIRNGEYFSKYQKIHSINKTKTTEEYKSILFSGNLKSREMNNLINEMSKTKKIYLGRDMNNLDNFSSEIDLIVVNFDKGKPHQEYGLFHMGVGYATKTPILELEGNPIPYPPLPGLARRTLVGNKRFEQAEHYLKELSSQHINDEAITYYKLMNKYNLNDSGN